MDPVIITAATEAEEEWTAGVMAGSEPWITLGWNLESCLEICRRPEYQVFVARRGGRLCGFVALVRRGVAGSPYIASIAVADGFRGSGIGSRLLDFAEDLFLATARHILLCVSSFILRARTLYGRRGYGRQKESRPGGPLNRNRMIDSHVLTGYSEEDLFCCR